jgi:hypothetical protein
MHLLNNNRKIILFSLSCAEVQQNYAAHGIIEGLGLGGGGGGQGFKKKNKVKILIKTSLTSSIFLLLFNRCMQKLA